MGLQVRGKATAVPNKVGDPTLEFRIRRRVSAAGVPNFRALKVPTKRRSVPGTHALLYDSAPQIASPCRKTLRRWRVWREDNTPRGAVP